MAVFCENDDDSVLVSKFFCFADEEDELEKEADEEEEDLPATDSLHRRSLSSIEVRGLESICVTFFYVSLLLRQK